MIKIPRQIDIGGHTYTIEFDDSLDVDQSLWGKHSNRQLRIQIYPNLKPSNLTVCLIHELLHAIDTIYNDRKLDETVINGLSEGLNQVFKGLGIELDWNEI